MNKDFLNILMEDLDPLHYAIPHTGIGVVLCGATFPPGGSILSVNHIEMVTCKACKTEHDRISDISIEDIRLHKKPINKI